jgi:tetratricopeptide (TPR) repeat protein
MRPLAFNRKVVNQLLPRIQWALFAPAFGAMFLGLVLWAVMLIWLTTLFGIPINAPLGNYPNGNLVDLIGFLALAPSMFMGYLAGWVADALVCRYAFHWQPRKIKAVFLYSEVPDRWLTINLTLPENAGPYRVKIIVGAIIGWPCIIFFCLAAADSVLRARYYPALVFLGFVGLGIYVVLSGGHYTFDQEGVTHECGFGAFRMRWRDIRRIEQNYGATVLIGESSRFVLPASSQWWGREKAHACALLATKIKASGIVPIWSASANLKWHNNVRVPRGHCFRTIGERSGLNLLRAGPRYRSALAIVLAIGAVLTAAAGFVLYASRSHSLVSQINARFAQLHINPTTIESTYQKGLRARRAIKAGDFAAADRIIADVISHSRIQNWRYYPFQDFVAALFSANDPQFGSQISKWVSIENGQAIPLLLRAKYDYEIGWATRGDNFAPKITPTRMAAFESYMTKALAAVDRAIRLDDDNPYAFYLKLSILQGYGISQSFITAFEQAVNKFPRYFPLYEITLSTLQPRWGGSIPAMYAFVERYAGSATQFSPLKLLYLSLYQHLLSTASIECSADEGNREKTAQCVDAFMQKSVRPGLEKHVLEALRLYDHTNQYQFGLAVRDVIFQMLGTDGGDSYSGAVLQLAAASMHSDTQLVEDKPKAHNNYIVDELTAESWNNKHFYENAITKYKEALVDAQSTMFPSNEERLMEVAFIYDKLAAVAEKQHRYLDEIIYEKAALALGVAWDAHYICYAYYQLKRYADAVRACSDAIRNAGNPNAGYWRGVAYVALGKPDKALKDLTKVADAEGFGASSAAIEMSMVYFNRHDNQDALKVLNKYTFLYDPNRSSRSSVAVAYNNRCYAYMRLGELKKALDDCTQSLKYGSIPDAFRKQQELVKRLGAHH